MQSCQGHTCCSSLQPSRKRQINLWKSVFVRNGKILGCVAICTVLTSSVWKFAHNCSLHLLSACKQPHYYWASSKLSSCCRIRADEPNTESLRRTWCASSEQQILRHAEQLWSRTLLSTWSHSLVHGAFQSSYLNPPLPFQTSTRGHWSNPSEVGCSLVRHFERLLMLVVPLPSSCTWSSQPLLQEFLSGMTESTFRKRYLRGAQRTPFQPKPYQWAFRSRPMFPTSSSSRTLSTFHNQRTEQPDLICELSHTRTRAARIKML